MFAEMVDALIGEVNVDGVAVKATDLTFGEIHKLRRYVRALSPDGNEDEGTDAEFVPALYAVVKQRTDPNFDLQQALELKPEDVAGPPPKARVTRAKKTATS